MRASVIPRLLTGIVVIVLAALPAYAFAHSIYSYDEYDYSYNTYDHLRAGICDQESDGNGAYVLFTVVNSYDTYRVNDANGSQPPCYLSSYFYSGIDAHRACENINNWPDHCGPWVDVY